MDITAEALEYLSNQAKANTTEGRIIHDGGHTFLADRDGDLHEFRPDPRAGNALYVHTLDAVTQYITHTAERQDTQLVVHVEDEGTVHVYSELDEYGRREELLDASVIPVKFPFSRWLDRETANIEIQSKFVETDNKALLLKYIGNLTEGSSHTQTDDGVTQTATIKTGVASVGEAKAPNPIVLKPYRTFLEVDQPESSFVFRMRGGLEVALYEADGGQWRNEAICNVSEYLNKEMAELSDRVTILA